MKPRIYITRRIPNEALQKLSKFCEITMWDEVDIPVPREELEKNIVDVEGLYCLLTETIDKNLLDLATRLKIISNMAVGYNNIDVLSASKKGIIVTNTPGVLTETTADLTFALLLSTARRVAEGDRFVREGNWKTWYPMFMTGQDVYGATIGIIGLGRIGEAVAKRAKGFGMNILYYNRNRKQELEESLGLAYVDMKSLLRESDFVVILTPYTLETENLIGYDELSLMKETAVLINTSRGGIVNEEALFEALVNNKIWAAGVDVFKEEPVCVDHPLLTLPNVTVLPHIGSASVKTRTKMALVAADNLIEGLISGKPKHIVEIT
jgi:glyoxylate reductase